MLLKAQKREIKGKKVVVLRAQGLIPAVLYGWGEKAGRMLSVNAREFRKIWEKAGEATLVELEIDGEKKGVLIQDVAMEPIRNNPVHVDFYAVQMDKLIQVSVPVTLEGESPAVKSLGAILVKVLHEIEIEALPNNLPHDIRIDISTLVALNDRLTVGDLKMPPGVTAITSADKVVAVAQAQVEEVVAETERTLEDIEVAPKGKKPLEEGEVAEGEKAA
jgi:large subunit ribosomal protein L25